MGRILVTGGAGFIGSHVADALLKSGHEVHVVDDLSGGTTDNLSDGVVFHQFDIRSDQAAELFERYEYDTMMHLAAQMDVRKSVADPSFDADINIRGTLNLLEAGRKSGLKKVVFSSTGGAIYGEPDYTPQDENHTLQPLSPYGITKLATEKYLEYYRHQYGLNYVALRYGNVYGPRQNPHGEAGVVAIFSLRMLAGEPVFINGDGLQTRDYVFVGDVVTANLAALGYDASGIFNVGTGIETDVVQLFRIIRENTAASVDEVHADGQPGEQRRSVLSADLAARELGWEPEISIKNGLRKTVDWFVEQRAHEAG
ncbi:MAG: NAD-dependent epimerase/dehydratase family protein [Bacteroidetes bacterium]|nr:MAG: NAD-dependent epimerase/dehydratase family protein [Bacteroidota bacterium]